RLFVFIGAFQSQSSRFSAKAYVITRRDGDYRIVSEHLGIVARSRAQHEEDISLGTVVSVRGLTGGSAPGLEQKLAAG
ncbi:MAG: hypothetical protein ACM3JB_23070, partial [Acidobacteriaceae bacterium]